MKTAIILGSGLSKISNELLKPRVIYSDKDGFHKAQAIEGQLFGKDVIVFSGRRHFYEGYTTEEILFFVKMAHENGVKLLIVSNAAGGINPSLKISDLMVITSFVNLMKLTFPGKICITHDSRKNGILKEIGLSSKLNLKFGTYCCNSGPAYETRSEIKFFKKYGIDAIGMSTAPEIIAARNLGIEVLGISCISNTLSENTEFETNHEEVVLACNSAYGRFSKLIELILAKDEEIVQC